LTPDRDRSGGCPYSWIVAWFRRRRPHSPAAPGPSYRPVTAPLPEAGPAQWTHPLRWRLDTWDQPDLVYAETHALAQYRGWDRYVPYRELVQCAKVVKPALFFKIGSAEFADWANHVEPQEIVWNWYRTEGEVPYVVVDLHVLFVNSSGTAIGVGGAGTVAVTTHDALLHSHRLRSRTLLDPADPAHREAIEAWVAGPAPTMLFFVEENFRNTSYVSLDIDPAGKRIALEKLAEATRELDEGGVVSGGFCEACAFIGKLFRECRGGTSDTWIAGSDGSVVFARQRQPEHPVSA
jgi:hypothetical protein